MKYVILIFTIIIIIASLNPSVLKIGNMKGLVTRAVNSVKRDAEKRDAENSYYNYKTIYKASLLFSSINMWIYYVLLAMFVGSFTFTIIIALWIFLSLFEFDIVIKYLEDQKESKILNSYLYHWLTRVGSWCIYGYAVYFTMINW